MATQTLLKPAMDVVTEKIQLDSEHLLDTIAIDIDVSDSPSLNGELEAITKSTLINLPAQVECITDREELGRRIFESAMSSDYESITVECRNAEAATEFGTPIRGMLLALASGFGGVSATISPSLYSDTWPAIEKLVQQLDEAHAGDLWQPVGERSLCLGSARHLFVSVDHPLARDATYVFPNVLLEVVDAHLIDPEWFDRVVSPRCQDEALTFVYYGQPGRVGSLYERATHESSVHGVI